MALVSPCRRTSSVLLLLVLTCALGASAASVAAPAHCCPEPPAREAGTPQRGCASIVPAACCDHGMARTAAPSVSAPAALPVVAGTQPPGNSSAFLRAAFAFRLHERGHATLVLRL